MKIIDPHSWLDLQTGSLHGQDAAVQLVTYRDMVSLFDHRDDSIEPQTVMYEVHQTGPRDTASGELFFGLSVLKPVTVMGQANMTRGHFHADRSCAEFYFGISGTGYLALMDQDGNCWLERVCRGSLHHIPGRLAHRLINIGSTDLKVGCCWPAAAGHDYQAIQSHPFPCHVYLIDGRPDVREDRH